MNTPIRIGLTAGLFVFIFFFGFWISRTGKPYNGLLFTLHKLISLGTIVYLGLTIDRVNQAAPLGTVQIALITGTALLFVGTMATGGVMSAVQEPSEAVHRLHQILPYLTVLSTGALLYTLLLQGRQAILIN